MRRRVRAAFTLVELPIVVVILGILALAVVPQFTGATSEATASSPKAQLKIIREQIDRFTHRVGARPIPSTPGATGWSGLVGPGGDQLQDAPGHPAFQGADKTGFEVVTGSSRIPASNAWAWNATDHTIHAATLNESTGRVSATATDRPGRGGVAAARGVDGAEGQGRHRVIGPPGRAIAGPF